MSYTEIYKFKKNGNAELLGETRNAFRGAMAVWNIMDSRYLPPFVPDWAKRLGETDKTYNRSSDMFGPGGGALKEVWGLYRNDKVSEVDKIVLGSTFDNIIVMKKDLPKLINAFRAFEGETSLKEQADLIEESLKTDKNLIAIAWNQTSVNGDTWSNFGGYDNKKEEDKPYNILKMDRHSDLFEGDEESSVKKKVKKKKSKK